MKSWLVMLLGIFCLSAFAQIEVHEEPMHQPVLTNKEARVLDVKAQPGDTSLLHQHSNNYCYVTINGGTVWLDETDKEQRTASLPSGFISGYYDNPNIPLIHRFANLSANTLRLIAVENLSETGDPDAEIFRSKAPEQVVADNDFFRILKFEVKAKSREIINCPYPTVLINLNENPFLFFVNNQEHELSTWQWFDKNAAPVIRNNNSDPADLVLVQIKQPK